MITDIPTVFSGFIPVSSIPNTVGVQVLGKLDETIRESGEYEAITDLVLDEIQFNSFTPEIHQMLNRCKNLTYLSMEFCELNSLQNINIFPNLEILELGYNKLKDKDIEQVASILTLRSLVLTKNSIESIQSLSPLSALPNLFKLTLNENPLTTLPNYRQKVFQILPKLQILDSKDRENQSINSDCKEEEQESYEQDEEQEEQQEEPKENNAEGEVEGDGEPPIRKIMRLEGQEI